MAVHGIMLALVAFVTDTCTQWYGLLTAFGFSWGVLRHRPTWHTWQHVHTYLITPAAIAGGPARRETSTMPQWAGSCWYYLRFIDPNNGAALVDKEKEQYWMPVDLYVGGAEHAVLHLLYARFWHKVGSTTRQGCHGGWLMPSLIRELPWGW